jgi:hypothetical protein
MSNQGLQQTITGFVIKNYNRFSCGSVVTRYGLFVCAPTLKRLIVILPLFFFKFIIFPCFFKMKVEFAPLPLRAANGVNSTIKTKFDHVDLLLLL